MASKMTNDAVAALKRRQAAEMDALVGAAAAADVVGRAQQRRADELQRLDVAVDEAQQVQDVALAVLATLMSPDVAAGLADVSAARMRQAQQRAAADEVQARVAAVTDGVPVPRRRGRPRGSGARPSGDRSAVAPEAYPSEGASMGLSPVVPGEGL